MGIDNRMHLSKPRNPVTGDSYIDTKTSKVYTYIVNQWKEVQGPSITPVPNWIFSDYPLFVRVKSVTWWIENNLEISKWLKQGNGRVIKTDDFSDYVIELDNESCKTYFKLKWG